jgi:hypothetical protein
MAEQQVSPSEARSLRISEIRMMAMAEIATKSTGMDHWAYYVELNELKRRPLSIEWLEGVIMLAVIGRIRPARVFGWMNKLREKREKLGQMDDFASFDTRLRNYLYPETLTNHGYDRQTFADLDHDSVWSHVESHLSALRDEGYEVFLNSGTLLGVVRDEKLIEHDDDIDLAVILKAGTEEEAAQEWRDLKGRLQDLELFDEDNHRQAAIYKLTPAGQTQIDLFPAWVQNGKVFVYPHTHGELALEDVLPLRKCAVTGNALPAAPEKMLTLNYGTGWDTPDPLFKFPWAAANDRFAPFLKRLAK